MTDRKIVQVTVDGRSLTGPEGAPLLQVMLDAGMDIPHYCYHPKLSIDGSCRLCQVKIEGVPKLQISCNTPMREGMVVHVADPEVDEARRGVLELLLLNHPLDCPICDKAGECWLQNYSIRFGSREQRSIDPRRKRGKRMDIGERMLLDQERCILCRRCVRFCREISKTGELVIFNLGDQSLLDIYDQRLDNRYSMCTADVCPVGALETKDFHHRIRVWFLEEEASVCPGCANGCNIMICHHVNRIWRLMPRRNDAVNDTWMCDAGRFTYKDVHGRDRIFGPMVKRDGKLVESGWSEAIAATSDSLRRIVDKHGGAAIGAIASPHLTVEDNFHFRRMLQTIGIETVAMAVPRWEPDDLLIKAERAANARGVRELGLVNGSDDGLEQLLSAAEAGAIKALYVCGVDLAEVVERSRLEKIASSVELLLVQAMTLKSPLDRPAVFLPSTAWAEKTGTFVNYAGRVQRILRAIEPPSDWMMDTEIFVAIRNHICGEHERFDLAATWRDISRECPAFAQVNFDQIGPDGVQVAPESSKVAA